MSSGFKNGVGSVQILRLYVELLLHVFASETSMTPPQIGERWLVAWRDGTVHLAEIVEMRSTKNRDADIAGGHTGRWSIYKAPADGFSWTGECVYVHYVDFDRRLDEWVSMDRIDLSSGQQRSMVAIQTNEKKRPATRMKRELL